MNDHDLVFKPIVTYNVGPPVTIVISTINHSLGTPQFVNVQRSPGARLRAGVATEAGCVAASAKSTPPVAVWGAQIWRFSPQMFDKSW